MNSDRPDVNNWTNNNRLIAHATVVSKDKVASEFALTESRKCSSIRNCAKKARMALEAD